MTEEERQQRVSLWTTHGCPMGSLYGDDGEMQCQCWPTVDWRRDHLDKLYAHWEENRKTS